MGLILAEVHTLFLHDSVSLYQPKMFCTGVRGWGKECTRGGGLVGASVGGVGGWQGVARRSGAQLNGQAGQGARGWGLACSCCNLGRANHAFRSTAHEGRINSP